MRPSTEPQHSEPAREAQVCVLTSYGHRLKATPRSQSPSIPAGALRQSVAPASSQKSDYLPRNAKVWEGLGRHQQHLLQNHAFSCANCPVAPLSTKEMAASGSERTDTPRFSSELLIFVSWVWDKSLKARLYGATERKKNCLNPKIFILCQGRAELGGPVMVMESSYKTWWGEDQRYDLRMERLHPEERWGQQCAGCGEMCGG